MAIVLGNEVVFITLVLHCTNSEKFCNIMCTAQIFSFIAYNTFGLYHLPENFDRVKRKEKPQVFKLMSEDELADCKKKLKVSEEKRQICKLVKLLYLSF